MVEDGGCYVVGSCRCPRSRPGYLPVLADALDARTIRAHPVMGLPIAAVSMHSLAVVRHLPPQLIDRALDPESHGLAFHVAGCQQLIGALGGR